ncbi:hypothetical protein [Sphingopyxis sp.]|uniref:hypothetical protein n=1 Tax=Sphingopyxis sp. TaxID=1908224 RepID=UPI002D79A9AB|nr:hypothetical protein [Sphingopyxis sp.]HET6526350.1 hypothetical protein [Sphingopyxis sp.]
MRALRSARSRRKRGHTTVAIADYFEDKEATVRAIIEPMFDEFDEMLDPGGEVEDIRKRFRRRADRLSSIGDGWMMWLPVEPERSAPEGGEALIYPIRVRLSRRSSLADCGMSAFRSKSAKAD